MIDKKIYCDWGTTSLRVRIINEADVNQVHEITADKGIAAVYKEWCKVEGIKSDKDRIDFYLAVLKPYIDAVLKDAEIEDESLEVVMSGMASSNIGMVELPYAVLPFALDGNTATAHRIAATTTFKHDILLISGVKGESEVMRGEETQLVGVAISNPPIYEDQDTVFIFPGTHSKHIFTRNGFATKFETYITGELFAILCSNGLLKDAVQSPSSAIKEEEWTSFYEGIDFSGTVTLLRSLFKIRTNYLFDQLTKQQNYLFLSGLLIGYELRSLSKKEFGRLVLCSEQKIFEYYKRAISHLGLNSVTNFIDPVVAKNATIKGQAKIADYYVNELK